MPSKALVFHVQGLILQQRLCNLRGQLGGEVRQVILGSDCARSVINLDFQIRQRVQDRRIGHWDFIRDIMQGVNRTPVHGCSRSEVWWYRQEVCIEDEKEEPYYFSILMTFFWVTIWVCILHFAFCFSYQKLRYAKSLQADLGLLFHAFLQQTPRARIAPATMESNCHTKLQHVSALRIFHRDYFSRLHSDFQYDMLSFRARCFPYSVYLVVLTNTPSLNAKWESLTHFSNWPNNSVPEIKDRTNL